MSHFGNLCFEVSSIWLAYKMPFIGRSNLLKVQSVRIKYSFLGYGKKKMKANLSLHPPFSLKML